MSGHGPAPLQPGTPDEYGPTLLARVPELGQLAHVETRIVFNLDSSDIGPAEWCVLGRHVALARDQGYDGIVIIHGTDTMAYTACALSFALDGLDRPVVLTGSQRPLGEIRTDARRNLVDAVDLATRDLPEVGICFDGQLLRGNRATKGDAWSYHAFSSPGCAPLARLGLDVEVAAHVRRPEPDRKFVLADHFDARVVVAHVTPGMQPEQLQWLGQGARGMVLSAFGVGTMPARGSGGRTLSHAVEALVQNGIVVLVVTQAGAGAVDLTRYENGAALARAGAIGGGDLRIEAAVVKLMHGLASYADPVELRQYLERDVAGERSV